jgi:hypothetical protein
MTTNQKRLALTVLEPQGNTRWIYRGPASPLPYLRYLTEFKWMWQCVGCGYLQRGRRAPPMTCVSAMHL